MSVVVRHRPRLRVVRSLWMALAAAWGACGGGDGGSTDSLPAPAVATLSHGGTEDEVPVWPAVHADFRSGSVLYWIDSIGIHEWGNASQPFVLHLSLGSNEAGGLYPPLRLSTDALAPSIWHEEYLGIKDPSGLSAPTILEFDRFSALWEIGPISEGQITTRVHASFGDEYLLDLDARTEFGCVAIPPERLPCDPSGGTRHSCEEDGALVIEPDALWCHVCTARSGEDDEICDRWEDVPWEYPLPWAEPPP